MCVFVGKDARMHCGPNNFFKFLFVTPFCDIQNNL